MKSENNLLLESDKRHIVRVFIEKGDSAKKDYFFKDTFRIGREDSSAVKINDGLVSRDHIEVSYKKGEWWIADLFSSNGTYIDGKKLDHLKLSEPIKLELGKNGPIVQLDLVPESDSRSVANSGVVGSLTSYIQRYFKEETDNPNIGTHTRMIQQAFKVVKKKQSKKYIKIIIGVVAIAVAAAAYSIYKHIEVNKLLEKAKDDFYSIQEEKLRIDSLIALNDWRKKQYEVEKKLIEKKEKQYDRIIEEFYSSDTTDILIQRVARRFGECEINIPEEFSDTVKKYIKEWQWRIGKGNKYERAIERAQKNSYTKIIVENFLKRDLPPQFFYLALQESEFIDTSVGPITYCGYAKGIWQFIATTAEAYDLKVGPLSDIKIYDPNDERFDFMKATDAAARYIKVLYSTEAQASGLLVMASYNWGGAIRHIKKLGDNTNYVEETVKYIKELNKKPKYRNFWKLITMYRDKVPKETYNYVFRIFSAAVIGEDPEYFGFKFKNPLKSEIDELEINYLNQ